MSSLFDDLLFPTIQPSVATPKSISITQDYTPLIVEAGTQINVNLSAVFNPGAIRNGIGTIGPDLVGGILAYRYFQNSRLKLPPPNGSGGCCCVNTYNTCSKHSSAAWYVTVENRSRPR